MVLDRLPVKVNYLAVCGVHGVIILGVARNELDIIFICAVVVIKLDLGEANFALGETCVPEGGSL